MGLRVNTNVPSLTAQRTLSQTNMRIADNLRRLSSGQRITKAGDDAAGLAISEKFKAQIRGAAQAKRNANDAISLIQTAEGGLNEISGIVIRLRELAVQNANDTLGESERRFSNIEFQQLKEEIDRISKSSDFNGRKLLDGSGTSLDFQIGIYNDPILDRLVYDTGEANSTLRALGLTAEGVLSKESSRSALGNLDNAIVQINGIRSGMGALQNRLSSVVNNLGINEENLSAANSRIRDVDIAKETSELTKNNILIKAGTSVLAQANNAPNIALQLLQG